MPTRTRTRKPQPPKETPPVEPTVTGEVPVEKRLTDQGQLMTAHLTGKFPEVKFIKKNLKAPFWISGEKFGPGETLVPEDAFVLWKDLVEE